MKKTCQNEELLIEAVALATRAGDAIMAVYDKGDVETTLKADRSPLTNADMASHRIIIEGLKAVAPEVPVLSEESDPEELEKRREWKRFWLVDPLDGTKEFLNRNNEFTVNIALIEDARTVLGVVHAPAVGLTYFAAKGKGAFKRTTGAANAISSSLYRDGALKIVASRSHGSDALERFLERLGPVELLAMGSSLKLCSVAEGKAHLYPRFGTTMEWDTAAAQCVVEEAGGTVTDLQGRPLVYNKLDLRNPFFMVCSDPAISWKEHTGGVPEGLKPENS